MAGPPPVSPSHVGARDSDLTIFAFLRRPRRKNVEPPGSCWAASQQAEEQASQHRSTVRGDGSRPCTLWWSLCAPPHLKARRPSACIISYCTRPKAAIYPQRLTVNCICRTAAQFCYAGRCPRPWPPEGRLVGPGYRYTRGRVNTITMRTHRVHASAHLRLCPGGGRDR